MFKNSLPSTRDYNICSSRNKYGICTGGCKNASSTQAIPKCDCTAYKKGCPCQRSELCKRQCTECNASSCPGCTNNPGCPVSGPCAKKCKCQFVQVCSCDTQKVCKKRCAKEGQYPSCPQYIRPPQQLPKKRACNPQIDIFISRIGMGDVTLTLQPIPEGPYQLKPLTLRQMSECVTAPKVNPCPKKPCKCKCGK